VRDGVVRIRFSDLDIVRGLNERRLAAATQGHEFVGQPRRLGLCARPAALQARKIFVRICKSPLQAIELLQQHGVVGLFLRQLRAEAMYVLL